VSFRTEIEKSLIDAARLDPGYTDAYAAHWDAIDLPRSTRDVRAAPHWTFGCRGNDQSLARIDSARDGHPRGDAPAISAKAIIGELRLNLGRTCCRCGASFLRKNARQNPDVVWSVPEYVRSAPLLPSKILVSTNVNHLRLSGNT